LLILEDQKRVSLNCLAFSPDGRSLAAGGYHGAVRLWDLDTKQLSGSRSTGNWNHSAALFMPDGRGLLVLVGGKLCLFAPDGESLGHRPNDHKRRHFTAATVSTTGRVCLGFHPTYQLSRQAGLIEYALADFAESWKVRAQALGAVTALSYSRDGRLLACGRSTGEVTVRDALTGAVRHEPDGAPSEVKAIALAPDGRRVAWCAATQLHLWRLDPPEQVLRYSLGRTFFLSVAFHPSGEFFATANGDGKVDYWDARTGEHRQAFDWNVGKLNDVAFDANGDRAACCGEAGKVVVWDVDR
jgi:WD40 repeat protein